MAAVTALTKRGIVARHDLFDRLTGAGRVTHVSAPAGSGKTLLLQSWIQGTGVVGRVGWVSVPHEELDPQRFWISVIDALGATIPGTGLVRRLTPAPDMDGSAVVARLLADLATLDERIWLVIDDLHELRSVEAMRQLELLVRRSPASLRIVLATRHDLHVGLHRLRLEGELTELRAADLRLTLGEAEALFEASGVRLSDSAVARLHERTEGWAAGLRLAALSLTAHPDPGRFADEFSGSERTVADYLLAEVLDRQSEQTKRLLLYTSILDRVSGGLADVLTGSTGGERILQELEEANAFVVSLDAGRSWFRYHQLFAELLHLELRRTEPGQIGALHAAAADWYAGNGHPIEAIRHAQAAGNWTLATHLLSDNWFGLQLNGQAGTAHDILAAFPAASVEADAELAALTAFAELTWRSLERSERYLELATRGAATMPGGRRARLQLMLAVLRLSLARQRGDLPAAVEEAKGLLTPAGGLRDAQLTANEDLRPLTLLSLGIAEFWSARVEEAEQHLDQGVALARRIGRPYLELLGLVHLAMVDSFQSFPRSVARSLKAIELAREHGWSNDPVAGLAYSSLGSKFLMQGWLEEAEHWLDQAEHVVGAEVEPGSGVMLHSSRGLLELAHSHDEDALRAFQHAERHVERFVKPRTLAVRGLVVLTLVRLGEIERAKQLLAELDGAEQDSGQIRVAAAGLRLAEGDAEGASVTLARVVDGSACVEHPCWAVQALLLDAIAWDALGDTVACRGALERALDLAEPQGWLFPFLLHPAPRLLAAHLEHHTTHSVLITQIVNLLGSTKPSMMHNSSKNLHEALTDSQARVLRYLPTNLSALEIASELCVSVNTVKTHMRHVYDKLGVHRRAQAVERARGLGLLGSSPSTR
jgi:LuxR family maltose regulon positive regulatory protein